jgi:hypothetical protein
MKTTSSRALRTFTSILSGVVIAATSAAPLGDSAVGTGTVLGNAMNRGPSPARPQDKDWPVAKHTPTGQMFKIPFAVPDIRKAVSGWEYSGQLEFGYLGGDADEENARFRMYQDIDHGAYLNNFSLQLRKPEGGYTAEVTGGAAGRHDQYYGLQFGRVNQWNVKLFFSEIPHVFTHRYKSLWNGIGTANLTLLAGLTPGGTASIPADTANVLAVGAANTGSLSLTRKKGGVRFDLTLSQAWKAYIAYSWEKQKGARPFGAIWGNSPGNGPLEIPESIDADTEELLAGVQYVEGLNAFNVRLSASLFTNQLDTLTFEEPFRLGTVNGVTVPAAGAFTHGRFDLTPSNDAYNIRAEYTRSLPDFHRSYVTAVVSAGAWRQDDNLIPYMVTPGVALANVTLQPGGNWDSVTALSRRSADAVINTRLADLTFSLNPTEALNVKARARYYETDNDMASFLSVNPNATYLDADSATAGNQSRGLTLDGLTGVWGRPLNDGTGQAVLFGPNANPAGNIPIKSKPFSARRATGGLTADQRLGKDVSVNAALERETTHRDFRERDSTWEDKAKVGLVHRALRDGSARLSYEFARRRGDDYVPTTYDQFFSPALVAIPTTPGANVTSWIRMNSGFRSLELADRDQHTVNGRLDTMLRPNLDAGLSGQLRTARFPDSVYGLTAQDQYSANLDLNYQPSPQRTIYAFYSYQFGRSRQASIASGNGNVVIGAASAFGPITPANAVEIGSAPGGPVYPLNNTWFARSADRNHVAGFGLKQDWGKASLNVDYSYSTGRSRIQYSYNAGGALNAAAAALAGNRMPDLATDVSYLDASLRVPLTERLAARLVYRHQREAIRDWHYRNVDTVGLIPGNAGAPIPSVFLDEGPENYTVNWFGVLFQLKL